MGAYVWASFAIFVEQLVEISVMMDIPAFIDNYREAFGERAALPILFYYGDTPVAPAEKTNGCMFRLLVKAMEGQDVTLSADTVTCGGGKHYAGFAPLREYVYTFVSEKERYKATPEDVAEYVEHLDVKLDNKKYLNFVRIDRAASFDGMEGLLFFATPDMLSGLAAWAYFDNNAEDAVSAPFGAGCTSVISYAVRENRLGGRRTFIGLFDPSVRPYVDANVLSFVIPASRFAEMSETMRKCCLFGSAAWDKVRQRM